jgi:hypothetical protein
LKNLISFFSALLMGSHLLVAQPVFFEITFGTPAGDYSRCLKQNASGSIFVAGFSENGSWGGIDIALSKISRTGTVLWTKFYGDSLDQFANWFVFSSDGYIMMVGETQTATNGLDYFFTKLDTNGNVIWTRTYGDATNQSIRHIEQMPDGGYILTGFTNDAFGSNDTYLVKTDGAGNIQWTKTIGGTDNDYGFSTRVMPNGTLTTSGDTKSFGSGGYDINLTHMDSGGNIIWDYYYGDAFQNGCQGLNITADGRLLSFGETEIFMFSPFEFFLEMIDTNGNSQWRRTFGGVNADAMFGVVQNPDLTFTFTGYSNSYNTGPLDLVVGKVDSTGNIFWVRSYGGSGIDIGYDMVPSLDGGFLICGHYTDTLPSDFYLLHVDQAGLLTGLNPGNIQGKAHLWPNPNPGSFSVSLPNTSTPVKIQAEIYNGSGHLIKRVLKTTNANYVLDFNELDLAPGLYNLVLSEGLNTWTTRFSVIK